LYDCDVIVNVEVEELIHARKGHDDAARDRRRRARESGAGSTGCQRDAVASRKLGEFAYLLGVRWPNDREWFNVNLVQGFVVEVVGVVLVFERRRILTDDGDDFVT
jgi:hypothetical protein